MQNLKIKYFEGIYAQHFANDCSHLTTAHSYFIACSSHKAQFTKLICSQIHILITTILMLLTLNYIQQDAIKKGTMFDILINHLALINSKKL